MHLSVPWYIGEGCWTTDRPNFYFYFSPWFPVFELRQTHLPTKLSHWSIKIFLFFLNCSFDCLKTEHASEVK